MILFDKTPFKLSFEYELSYFLVPFTIILYYLYTDLRSILMYHMVCIGIVGSIGTLHPSRLIENGIAITILSVFFHIILLVVLYEFKLYGTPNPISILLLIIANIIIVAMPYCPYKLSKKQIIILYNLIYFILLFMYSYLIY
jgi:hypothetical protein